MPSHEYSPAWYSTFLDTIPIGQTEREVAFISRQMPLESHGKVLDVCCGPGRHANRLARAGYRVVGIDNNAAAIERARAAAPEAATYRVGDMRNLEVLGERFDAVTNLWASFGYFDDATNEAVLRQIAGVLRPGGRALIDLYNREHMLSLPASEMTSRDGMTVTTERFWTGNRLRVRLAYSSGASDEFEWRLYTADELSELCSLAGLTPVLTCAWFTETLPASAEHARMQLVLERSDAQ
ncbi:MAG TPA: class I SAM-dependent methyltransferase [Gemmatimonadaceae bacterium]